MSKINSEVSDRRLALRLKRARYHQPMPRKRVKKLRGARKEEQNGSAGAQIEALQEKFRDQMTRIQAEFDNYRKRARKEVDDIKQSAGGEALKGLLPILDNFSRALQTPAASLEGFVEGVRMINTLLENYLTQAGLTKIGEPGQPFDPNFHEAVMVDASGDLPENQIVEVFQTGYLLNGKLVRPALVKVSRKM